MKFPIFKTKIEGVDKKFNLTNPLEGREYFELKARKDIEKLRGYLEKNTFVAYLLGKKNSGKGTYSKMFAAVVEPERIEHFSIGDAVRAVDSELKKGEKRRELMDYLKRNYRGSLSPEGVIAALEGRSTETLLPTELILGLVRREMERKEKKAIFIDGFPRDMDQIDFSLFFRDLIGHRDDPDIFVLIDVPENVINERIKWRRICPVCHTSRNLKLLPTSRVGYDKEKKEFYLICDNDGERMVRKEGDELGIEPIRKRLKLDEQLMEKAFSLYGIPKVLLRNSVPVNLAKDFVDDYEITPEYVLEREEGSEEVKVKERPWVFKDDQGIDSFSLMPQPVVVSLISQITKALNL